MIDREIMITRIEPCQYHEHNVCIGGVTKECTKYIQNILDENAISMENSSLRIYATCA